MVENLTRHIAVRTTPRRRQLYAQCAAREGVRLSEWIRRLADRAAIERAEVSTDTRPAAA